MRRARSGAAGDTERMLAGALAGDPDALGHAGAVDLDTLDRHRLVPVLAVLRRQSGLGLPAAWRQRAHSAAARWLALEATRAEVAETLAEADVAWAPIKGCDVADRFYPAPESRPAADLDVLVPSDALVHARRALEVRGWQSLAGDPRTERYLVEEGYAWPAIHGGRPLLEVHFRLWGLAPAELGDRVLDDAATAGSVPFARPDPADAYLLAAVHHLLAPPPRPMLGLLDLERIALHGDEELAERVVERARSFDLPLPVRLSAAAAAALWPTPTHEAVAQGLEPDLRRAERLVARRAGRAASLRAVVLARLLAGRRSRAGWRSVLRRLWSHPGVVAAETPGEWWWPRRRLVHVARQLGMRKG